MHVCLRMTSVLSCNKFIFVLPSSLSLNLCHLTSFVPLEIVRSRSGSRTNASAKARRCSPLKENGVFAESACPFCCPLTFLQCRPPSPALLPSTFVAAFRVFCAALPVGLARVHSGYFGECGVITPLNKHRHLYN